MTGPPKSRKRKSEQEEKESKEKESKEKESKREKLEKPFSERLNCPPERHLPKGFSVSPVQSLFLNEERSDILLRATGGTIPAHSLILQAQSSFFESLREESRVKGIHYIDLDPHISYDGALAFVKYLYYGTVASTMPFVTVKDCYHLAGNLKVRPLFDECGKKLVEHLDENRALFLSIAMEYGGKSQAFDIFIDDYLRNRIKDSDLTKSEDFVAWLIILLNRSRAEKTSQTRLVQTSVQDPL